MNVHFDVAFISTVDVWDFGGTVVYAVIPLSIGVLAFYRTTDVE
jgi:hypothetical protein